MPDEDPWHWRDSGARLERDRQLIAPHFPDLRYVTDPDRRQVGLRGSITLNMPSGAPINIPVLIHFPNDYPRSEPAAYDLGDRFLHELDNHITASGYCCLWHPLQSLWRPKDDAALLHFLRQLVVFYERQLVYEALPPARKRWPGPQFSHGQRGTFEAAAEFLNASPPECAQLLKETAAQGLALPPTEPCPCGRERSFAHCHRARLLELRNRLPAGTWQDLLEWVGQQEIGDLSLKAGGSRTA